MIDAVLDGELSAEQGRRLLEQSAAGPDAVKQLEQMIELSSRLEKLPAEHPPRQQAGAILATIRSRQHLGRATRAKTSARLGWAAAGALAGAALAATIAVPLLRPPQPPPHEVFEPQPPCRARKVIGPAELERNRQVAMLRLGQKLMPADHVRAGARARVEIDIDNDARLLLYRQSALRVTGLERRLRVFSLDGGRVRVEMLDGGRRVVRLLGTGNKLRVEGRRGTFALLELDDGRAAVAALREAVLVHCAKERQLRAGMMLKFSGKCTNRKESPVPEEVMLEVEKPAGRLHPGKVLFVGRTDSHARLWVDGRLLDTGPDGSFSTRIDILAGDVVTIVAEDVVGNTKTVELGPAGSTRVKKTPGQPIRRVRTKGYRVIW